MLIFPIFEILPKQKALLWVKYSPWIYNIWHKTEIQNSFKKKKKDKRLSHSVDLMKILWKEEMKSQRNNRKTFFLQENRGDLCPISQVQTQGDRKIPQNWMNNVRAKLLASQSFPGPTWPQGGSDKWHYQGILHILAEFGDHRKIIV